MLWEGELSIATKELLPELSVFDLAGREVMICYDSDAAENVRVREAEIRLARTLTRRDARVRIVRLPPSSGEKVALDDFLKSNSPEDFEQVCWSSPLWQAYQPPVSFAELMEKECPPIDWVWDSFVLKGEVNLLYGDGGTGKSLLALHLAAHVAYGRPLFGRSVVKMPVIAMLTEDSEAEVKARLQTIQRIHRLPLTSPPLSLWCQPNEDTLLADIDDKGRVKELERLESLRSELRKFGQPALVILDGMADLFAIDETNRLPVTAAIKRVLGSLCREFGATILVLAHPSKASMMDGSHYSGSTAFNNAVRQRLTLEIEKDAGNVGPPPRRLKVAKSNYGAQAELRLWIDNRALVTSPPGREGLTPTQLQDKVLNVMLKLIEAGVRVVNRNGSVGGAMSLNQFVRKVNEDTGLNLQPREVADMLLRLREAERLGYVESDDSIKPKRKAHFVKGAKADG